MVPDKSGCDIFIPAKSPEDGMLSKFFMIAYLDEQVEPID